MNVIMGRKNEKKYNLSNETISLSLQNGFKVENMVVTSKEHKILWKYRVWLQQHFKVKMCLPRTEKLRSDIIFASIEGTPENINHVKTFLNTKLIELSDSDIESSNEDGVEVITVSDSESEAESEEICEVNSENMKPDQKHPPKDGHDIYISENNPHPSPSTLETPTNSCNTTQRRSKKRFHTEATSSESSSNEVTSTTNDEVVMKKAKLSESVLIIEEPCTSNQSTSILSQSVLVDEEPGTHNETASALTESVIIIDELDTKIQPAEEFISLTNKTESVNRKIEHVNKRPWFKSTNSNVSVDDDDVKIINEPKPNAAALSTLHPQPKTNVVSRRLRPIVIDGSNVAMEHGKPTHSFSVYGIKIALDYFINRGHMIVTAFVPKFRKNTNPRRSYPTTGAYLFEELEQNQRVVYTPSRYVDGERITSYDDRFIVKFAASNGGIIVSNDNFRDLLDIGEEVKEAIQRRLLQFCFVGDTFMVPDDPLGKKGPTLDDFLCFPPESK